jgi:hypothetical protein
MSLFMGETMKRMLLSLAVLGGVAPISQAAVVHLDLALNLDTIVDVVQPGGTVDTSQTGIDSAGSFATVGAVTQIAGAAEAAGNLPDNGFFAAGGAERPFSVQLEYGTVTNGGNTSRTLSGGSFNTAVTQGAYDRMHVFATSSLEGVTPSTSNTGFTATLFYSDSTSTTTARMEIDDQFDDGGQLNAQPAGVASYHLINGADRVNNIGDAVNSADDISIFGISFPVDPTKQLISVTLEKVGGGQADIFGISAVQAVPEPAALSMLALGGLMALRRRRQA